MGRNTGRRIHTIIKYPIINQNPGSMPLTSISPGSFLSHFITIQRPSSIPLTLHLVVAFYYMASGMAGKSKDRFRVRQKQQGYPHALKPLYATVSCQFLRPRVRATSFCEEARCAMKTQQRNTKHTQFESGDIQAALLECNRVVI